MGRTLIDPEDLVREVTAGTGLPGIVEWAEENLRTPATDVEALELFAPRDER